MPDYRRAARTKLLTVKYVNNTHTAMYAYNFTAACELEAAWNAARARQTAVPIENATRAKNTPVTCSHTTLENRTTGATIELFACWPAALTVLTSGMRTCWRGWACWL